jgi:hypothetical protein
MSVLERTSKQSLHAIIHKNVEPGTSVFTDAYPSYRGLSPDFMHYFVDHMETYVMGQIHTNGLENL